MEIRTYIADHDRTDFGDYPNIVNCVSGVRLRRPIWNASTHNAGEYYKVNILSYMADHKVFIDDN